MTALLTYIVVCVAGGAAYYYYTYMMPPPVEAEAGEMPPPPPPGPPPGPPPEEKTEEAQKAELARAKAEAAAKAAEEAKAKALAKQEAKKSAALRDIDRARLTAAMEKNKNGTVTIYSYYRPDQPPSGLYLNPSLAVGRSCRLQYEIYYYYNIRDGNGEAWIFGDSFVIKAGGKHYEFPLNPPEASEVAGS